MSNQAAWITGSKVRPLKVDRAERWTPGEGEILIKNSTVAVNPVDWKIQDSGFYVSNYPNILGEDLAGVIEQVGAGVTRFKVGQRVMAHAINLATTEPRHGAFQQYTVASERLVASIPDSLAFERACVLPLAISTAAAALYQTKHLGLPLPQINPQQTGKVIVIYGGSSSVGSTAIQLAVASGLTVATIASSKHVEYVKSLGATHVYDSKKPSLVDDVVSDLKDSQFVGIFDTISVPDTVTKSAEIGKKLSYPRVAITLPTPKDLPEGVQVSNVWAVDLYDNDREIADTVWGNWVPRALLDGSLQPKPDPLLFDGGLSDLQSAFGRQKEGVSAAKVVVAV